MWITNGSVADIAVIWAQTDEGIRGFCIPTKTAGLVINPIKHKLSLRASITSELVFNDMKVPDSYRLPEATSLRAPLLCLTEARYGIILGQLVLLGIVLKFHWDMPQLANNLMAQSQSIN